MDADFSKLQGVFRLLLQILLHIYFSLQYQIFFLII